MRYSIGLPVERVDASAEFVTGDAIAEMAAAAEAAGFDACFVTDHPAPDTKWLNAGGHHALDPFVALSFAAAATTELRVHTHILVIAYRNPLLATKSIQSLQALSGNRMILGLGAGYLKAEFFALGRDFDARNDLLDEAIDTVRVALASGEIAGEGRGWSARGVSLRPPVEVPPIWIGGNSTAAIRRAIARGDAWVPFAVPRTVTDTARTAPMSTFADFERQVARLRELESELGRDRATDICFSPFSLADRRRHDTDLVREEMRALEQLGVSWATVGASGDTRAEWLDSMRTLADTLGLDAS